MKKIKLVKKFIPMTLLLLFVLTVSLVMLLVVNKNTTQDAAYAATYKTRHMNTPPHKISPTKPTQTRVSITPTTAAATTLIPQTTTLKLGAVVENYGNSNSITSFENQVGKKLDTLSIFIQFGSPYNKELDASQLSYIKSQGKQIQMAWEPWNPEQEMNQSEDYLTQITNGKYDEYIRQTARSLRSFGNPVYLRFGHEMNGEWYPWGRQPQKYVQAYKHVHDVAAQEGATNIRWMWCPNVSENPQELAAYYPGDAYVDIIGIDGFNFGTSQNYGGWRSFDNLFGPTYTYLSTQYNKPMIIAETASAEQGGNKGTWIKEMFSTIRTKYPKISEVIWFNLLKEADWRIDSSQATLNAYKSNL